jgi:hypothetical protein
VAGRQRSQCLSTDVLNLLHLQEFAKKPDLDLDLEREKKPSALFLASRARITPCLLQANKHWSRQFPQKARGKRFSPLCRSAGNIKIPDTMTWHLCEPSSRTGPQEMHAHLSHRVDGSESSCEGSQSQQSQLHSTRGAGSLGSNCSESCEAMVRRMPEYL